MYLFLPFWETRPFCGKEMMDFPRIFSIWASLTSITNKAHKIKLTKSDLKYPQGTFCHSRIFPVKPTLPNLFSFQTTFWFCFTIRTNVKCTAMIIIYRYNAKYMWNFTGYWGFIWSSIINADVLKYNWMVFKVHGHWF